MRAFLIFCLLSLPGSWALAETQEKLTDLLQRADTGDIDAMYRAGTHYASAKGKAPDWQQAFYWYRLAAAKNHAGAQYELGMIYFKGKGVEADEQRAFALIESAALAAHAGAQHFLGWMYEHGRGINKDLPNAIRWYRAASKQGHAKSRAALKNAVKTYKQR